MVSGVIGSVQAFQALKLLTGERRLNRDLILFQNGKFEEYNFQNPSKPQDFSDGTTIIINRNLKLSALLKQRKIDLSEVLVIKNSKIITDQSIMLNKGAKIEIISKILGD